MGTWVGSAGWVLAYLSKGQTPLSQGQGLDGAGHMTRPLWGEQFGNGLQSGLDVNFGIEIRNNSLLFP